MARTDLRHSDNVDGDWFVDTRCIDCGTFQDLAAVMFCGLNVYSVVEHQPPPGEAIDAWLAAQACPTNSIGTISRQARPGRLYPRQIEPRSGIFDCGYCSTESFGATSWLVCQPHGNVLVDSPRFTEALATPIAQAGGLAHVLLTHRDDVAEGARWGDRF